MLLRILTGVGSRKIGLAEQNWTKSLTVAVCRGLAGFKVAGFICLVLGGPRMSSLAGGPRLNPSTKKWPRFMSCPTAFISYMQLEFILVDVIRIQFVSDFFKLFCFFLAIWILKEYPIRSLVIYFHVRHIGTWFCYFFFFSKMADLSEPQHAMKVNSLSRSFKKTHLFCVLFPDVCLHCLCWVLPENPHCSLCKLSGLQYCSIKNISKCSFFERLLLYSFDRDRERAPAGGAAEGKGEADSPLCREPHKGLDPTILRPWPELKADP